MVPSPLQREPSINPHFRSLRRRGELFIQAKLVWYKQVSKEEARGNTNTKRRMFQSGEFQWCKRLGRTERHLQTSNPTATKTATATRKPNYSLVEYESKDSFNSQKIGNGKNCIQVFVPQYNSFC
mmetsp:Transcript_36349/g.42167  ORF Transcript_36349/g.42167 Transcript_36349/m.42167 type:complete len:125 (-) Transcript_36349:163-537(-)